MSLEQLGRRLDAVLWHLGQIRCAWRGHHLRPVGIKELPCPMHGQEHLVTAATEACDRAHCTWTEVSFKHVEA